MPREARAWLANWLPPVIAFTILLAAVYGFWALFTETARHPHLPPDPLAWICGTLWTVLALHAAMVASYDYKLTLVQWEKRDA